MTSLADMVLASQTKGPSCKAGAWLRTLDKKDRAEVDEALGHPEIQHAALARAIKSRWADAPGQESLTRHRKQECACGSS
jgi:hypothetical protein